MSAPLPPDRYPHVNSWAPTRVPFRFRVWIAASADPDFGPYLEVHQMREVIVWALTAVAACERARRREGIEEPLWWVGAS